MKIRKYLLLALSTLLFLGCTPSSSSSSTSTSASSSTSKTELGDYWKESELKLINEHLYGIEVPCMRIDGNSDLYYDEEYNELSMTGATVNSSILAEYADLFIKAGYTLTTNYEEDLIYSFEKTINYDGNEKTVIVDIYAESDVYYPEIDTTYFEFSKEGTFWLTLYDPFIYSWPKEEIAADMNKYLSSDVVIPSYDGKANFYYSSDFVDLFEGLLICCYTDNQNSVLEYEEKLVKSNWKTHYEEEKDVYYACDQEETILLVFDYDDKDKCLTIRVYDYSYLEEIKPSDPYNKRTVLEDYALALDRPEEKIGKYEDFYYIEFSLGKEEDYTLLEALELIYSKAPSYFLTVYEPFENTFGDGRNGAVALLVTNDNDIAIEVSTSIYEGEILVSIFSYDGNEYIPNKELYTPSLIIEEYCKLLNVPTTDVQKEQDVYYYFEVSLGKGVSVLEGCQSVTELSPDYLYLYEEPYEGNWVDGDEGAFSYLKIENLNIYVSIGTYIVDDECFVQVIVNYLEDTEKE